MTKTHGAKHSFLGMNIEFVGDETVMIDTNNYLREVIEDFEKSGHVIVGTNVTPAASNMSDISRKNAPLSTELTDVFRSTIAKLLWASQRSTLDLSFAVTFLCSRLNCATEGDWEKLRRLLGYHHPHEEEVISVQSKHYVHMGRRILRSSSRYAQPHGRSDLVWSRSSQYDVTQTTFKHDEFDGSRSGRDE